MKKTLQIFGFTMLLLVATTTVTAQTNIVIDDTTADQIFLYGGAEGDPFADNNGTGWSGSWTITSGTTVAGSANSLVYPTGSGTALYGGAISSDGTNIIERSFIDTYELLETTFYLSFLAVKTGASTLTLKGFSGTNPRYGMQITASGNLRVRASTKYGDYATGVFNNDVTYLVVIAKQGNNCMVTLFKEGDTVPTNPDDVTWLASATRATGADLDKFVFEFTGDNFKIDVLRLGSTLASVTKSDAKNYESPLSVKSFSSLKDSMYPNPTSGLVYINTSKINSENAKIQVIDLNGKILLSRKEDLTKDNIELDISSLSKGLYIIKLLGEKENYAGKLIIE